jgi:transketolase
MDMQEVYVNTLIELAEKDQRICVLEADLMRATGTKSFQELFPERTFNVGVAEANMVCIAAGLSTTGKIPFAATFGCFASRRVFDQFFLSANYAMQNVKLVGTDPGITAAFNGGTHMPFEDAGIMRNIPSLVVFEPCDTISLKKLLKKSAHHKGCTYMRLQRKGSITIYNENEEFELGKGKVLRDGTDITIIAVGMVMVSEALKTAKELEKQGISAAVIDMHSFKPLDQELVVKYARKTGAIITAENHQICNGLGSAVAECLSESYPTLMRRIGVQDKFGQVGTLDYLQQTYCLTAKHILDKAKELIHLKQKIDRERNNEK